MATFLSRFRVVLLLLAVAASWGSTYLSAQELVTPDSVVALLALRMLLAAVIMLGIVAARKVRIRRGEIQTGIGLGMLLSVVFLCETFGIAHTSATNAGLLISLTIVFTPLLEAVTSRRRLPGTFYVAVTVTIVGVALLAGNGEIRPPALGDWLIMIAAIARAVHVTSMHTFTSNKPMDSLHLTAVQLSTCAVIFSIASVFTGVPVTYYVAQLTTGHTFLFLYLVLVCTVFAFFVQMWAVRRTSPTRVSLLLGTEPVWAAIIGITIAHDDLTITGYCGIALVLLGTAAGRSLEQHSHDVYRPLLAHRPESIRR